MTVIAWDGKTLAADKAATNVGYRRTVTKVYKYWCAKAMKFHLVAFSGNGDQAMELLEWFRNGRDPATYPKFQEDTEGCTDCVFIDHHGTCWSYGKTAYPQKWEDKFNATGHGRDFALAAMHLGLDARQAVEVACALDNTCGNGVDAVTLD